ncbi:MAG: NACHT domain-containing protein [Pseudomonadota bacterium]
MAADLLRTALVLPTLKFLINRAYGGGFAAETAGGVLDWLMDKAGDDADDVYAKLRELARSLAAHVAAFAERERLDVDPGLLAKALDETLASVNLGAALVDDRLDPARLAKTLDKHRPPMADAVATAYDLVLERYAAGLCALAQQIPGFQTSLDRDILASLAKLREEAPAILEAVGRIDERGAREERERQEATDENERGYRATLRREVAKLRLFGLDRPPGAPDDTNLDISYIPLRLGLDGQALDFADALALLPAFDDRLLIEGIGGCGKTTLMQWATLRALEGDAGERRTGTRLDDVLRRVRLPDSLREQAERAAAQPGLPWFERTPFFVRLRDFADGELPNPEELVGRLAPQASGTPEGWVRECTEHGRALFLFDGLDEVAPDKRPILASSIESYLEDRSGCQVILTSRPGALDDRWRRRFGGLKITVEAMALVEIERFIENWYEAAAKPSDAQVDAEAVRRLIGHVTSRPALAGLAGTPLLCAAICYLNVVRRGDIPERTHMLFEILCEQLVHRLDVERLTKEGMAKLAPALAGLDRDNKLDLLSALAMFMVNERASVLERDAAATQLRIARQRLRLSEDGEPAALVDAFQERSGLLRGQSRDAVEFAHNRLRSYLAARAFRDQEAVRQPIDAALALADPDLPVLTAALGTAPFRERMVAAVLDAGGAEAAERRIRNIMAVRIGALGVDDPETRARLDEIEAELLPPRDADEAAQLAELKARIVPQLAFRPDRDEAVDAACVRCLRLIGGADATAVLREYFQHASEAVIDELAQAMNPLLIPGVAGIVRMSGKYRDYWPVRHVREADLNVAGEWISLNLIGASIRNAECFRDFKRLQSLILDGTQIKDVGPLASLSSLKELYLGGTPVRDIKPLLSLGELGRLFLRGTLVSKDDPVVRVLRERGVDVIGP